MVHKAGHERVFLTAAFVVKHGRLWASCTGERAGPRPPLTVTLPPYFARSPPPTWHPVTCSAPSGCHAGAHGAPGHLRCTLRVPCTRTWGTRSPALHAPPLAPATVPHATPCVTFRPVVVSLRGPGQSPVLPFACCVGSLRSVGRCGRCSCWCRFRVHGAQWLVCWGCAECGMVCRFSVSPPLAHCPRLSPCPCPCTASDTE